MPSCDNDEDARRGKGRQRVTEPLLLLGHDGNKMGGPCEVDGRAPWRGKLEDRGSMWVRYILVAG